MSLRVCSSSTSSPKVQEIAAISASPKKVYSVLSPSQRFTEMNANETEKKLLEVTHRYLGFINRISRGEAVSQEETGSVLSADCKKVLNGKLFTQNRADFISDLREVHRTQGGWTVKPVDILPSTPTKNVVLRLMINMEKLGPFTAIVILRFNENDAISEINEVFNKVDDSYHFEEGNTCSKEN